MQSKPTAEARAPRHTPEDVIVKFFMEAEPAAVRATLAMIKGIIKRRSDCGTGNGSITGNADNTGNADTEGNAN